jgi:hypothetical protein
VDGGSTRRIQGDAEIAQVKECSCYQSDFIKSVTVNVPCHPIYSNGLPRVKLRTERYIERLEISVGHQEQLVNSLSAEDSVISLGLGAERPESAIPDEFLFPHLPQHIGPKHDVGRFGVVSFVVVSRSAH